MPRWLVGVLLTACAGLAVLLLAPRDASLATLRGHDGPVRALCGAADRELLLSGGDDGALVLWDARSFRRVARLEGHRGKVTSLGAARGWAASAGEDHQIRLWELDPPAPREMPASTLATTPAECVALHPEANVLAASGKDHVVHLWSLPEGKSIANLPGHARRVLALAFSPDGKLLASAGEEGEIRLWEVPTGKAAGKLGVGPHRIHQLAFRPDGKQLACAVVGAGLRSWEWPGRKEQPPWEGAGQARGLCFEPTSGRLVSVHEDGTVKWWDAGQRQLLRSERTRQGVVLGTAAGGERLFTAGGDGTIKAWSQR